MKSYINYVILLGFYVPYWTTCIKIVEKTIVIWCALKTSKLIIIYLFFSWYICLFWRIIMKLTPTFWIKFQLPLLYGIMKSVLNNLIFNFKCTIYLLNLWLKSVSNCTNDPSVPSLKSCYVAHRRRIYIYIYITALSFMYPYSKVKYTNNDDFLSKNIPLFSSEQYEFVSRGWYKLHHITLLATQKKTFAQVANVRNFVTPETNMVYYKFTKITLDI